MTITPTQLRANLYRILDTVIETQQSIEIIRKGKILKLIPERKKSKSKLAHLKPHPGTIRGNPESLVHIDWSSRWKGSKAL